MCVCSPHIVEVGEQEGLVRVEPAGDDVTRVLQCVSMTILQRQILPQILLIISHLNHQGDVKHVLQPPDTHTHTHTHPSAEPPGGHQTHTHTHTHTHPSAEPPGGHQTAGTTSNASLRGAPPTNLARITTCFTATTSHTSTTTSHTSTTT
jgi:hypothetical protein